jgi:serine/threonine protein kinase
MIQLGSAVHNRYRIIREIAKGGMSLVYLARDMSNHSLVALKVNIYSQEQLQFAFEQEANLLAGLNHYGLPKVIDHFVEDDLQCLVMKFVPGDNLFELLQKTKRETKTAFELNLVLNFADQLLDILDYLHNRPIPIIHRDIKPHNIKIKPSGQLVLLDFGMAKESATSVPGGTTSYAPPEQVNRTGTNPRSDLYSFGVTIRHFITGVEPISSTFRLMDLFSGKSDPLLLANRINQNVPEAIANWISWATALDVERRPISAFEMRTTLRSIITELNLPVLPYLKEINHALIDNKSSFSNKPVFDDVETLRRTISLSLSAQQNSLIAEQNKNELPNTRLVNPTKRMTDIASDTITPSLVFQHKRTTTEMNPPNGVLNSVSGYSDVLTPLTAALPTTILNETEIETSQMNIIHLEPNESPPNAFCSSQQKMDSLVEDFLRLKAQVRNAETPRQKFNYPTVVVTACVVMFIAAIISIVAFVALYKKNDNNQITSVSETKAASKEPACTMSVSLLLQGKGKETIVPLNRVFNDGESFRFSVDSSCKGHVYLLTRDSSGWAAMLYPNRELRDNSIERNEGIRFPSEKPITYKKTSTDFFYFVLVENQNDPLAKDINKIMKKEETSTKVEAVAALFKRLDEISKATPNVAPQASGKIVFGGSLPLVCVSKIGQ